MSNPSGQLDRLPKKTRSRVTNGTAVLEGIDGRSITMRRYRDLLRSLIADLGGDPSAAQEAVARRASALCVACEAAEVDMLAGKPVNILEYATAANAMRRLLADLGIERRPKDISAVTLAQYVSRTPGAT